MNTPGSFTCACNPGYEGDGATCATVCGDGIVNAGGGEQCDDGNTVSGDGCSATCAIEITVVLAAARHHLRELATPPRRGARRTSRSRAERRARGRVRSSRRAGSVAGGRC